MHPSVSDHALRASGLAIFFGSMVWRMPYFPALGQRATLVKTALPYWAIASGITAGWVWTGMGYAEPWRLLRPSSPYSSPISRTGWTCRGINPDYDTITTIQGLKILSPENTIREILLGDAHVDAAAAQVLLLTKGDPSGLSDLIFQRRSNPTARAHARAVISRVCALQRRYPDITRYTS